MDLHPVLASVLISAVITGIITVIVHRLGAKDKQRELIFNAATQFTLERIKTKTDPPFIYPIGLFEQYHRWLAHIFETGCLPQDAQDQLDAETEAKIEQLIAAGQGPTRAEQLMAEKRRR